MVESVSQYDPCRVASVTLILSVCLLLVVWVVKSYKCASFTMQWYCIYAYIIRTHLNTHTHAHMCIYACTHACMDTHTHTYTRAYTHIHTHTHTITHTHIHTYTCTHTHTHTDSNIYFILHRWSYLTSEYPASRWPDLATTGHPSTASHGLHTPPVTSAQLVSKRKKYFTCHFIIVRAFVKFPWELL